MSADSESRARLCPEHRSDQISRKSCTACAQARRIDDLEMVVERLTERVEELESDANTAEETAEIAIPESESA